MVRYDGLLNGFQSLNFSRLTHPTNFAYRLSPENFTNIVIKHIYSSSLIFNLSGIVLDPPSSP